MLALSYWQLALLLWIAWLVGASFGLFWAGRRRSRMDYQTAMNIVWSTHCPDKKEPVDAL